jgi:PAS domain S-box-containing protein
VNLSGSQLTGLQFELAMAIGSSLDLEAMLDAVLEILLRRLDVSAAAVHARKPAGTRLVLALPRSARAEPQRPRPGEGALASACRIEALEAGGHRHEFELPGFGILTLDRRGPALEGAVLWALEPLMQRLGRAARACVDHAAVLASEARFATLVASVPEVIFEGRIETRGQLTLDYVSPRAREVLGHEAHDLVAQPGRLLERIVPADRESLTSALAVAAASETPFEHLVRIDDGGPRPRWLQIAAKPDDGRMAGVCRWSGLIQDVTARQQLAATEREVASLRMSALLGAVDDAIVGSDASGRITHWNHGAERMLGYSASAAIGERLELIIPERMHAPHAQAMAHHLATGEARVVGRPVELPARHADGHEIPVELVLSRVEDQGEIFFVGMLRDVTERRRIEQEQARSVEEERRLAAAFLELGRSAFQDLPGFERRLTEVVAAALGVARVSLWALEPDRITCVVLFEAVPGRHSSGTVLEERVYPSYFEALRDEPSIVAADARTHRATACFRESYLAPHGIVSMLDVPVRTLEGPRGVLCVEATEPRDWRPSEVRFCLEVSGLLAQATERLTRLRIEARHEVVLSSIGDAVIACDLHQRIILVNPVAEQLTGWSRQEALGRPLTEVFQLRSSETLEVIDSPVPMVLSTGRPQGCNRPALLAQRNGERTPVADSASPIIEDGEIRGVVLTFRDVREDEAARRALEQQNRRLRSLGEAIPDLLFSVSLDGRLHYIQESSSPNFAVDPAATPEQKVRSLFPPDLAETILGAVAQTVLSGEVQVVEYSLDAVHGEQWFEARLARMSEDEATVLVRNVSLERTRARSLQEERERLAAVLATTSAIIYTARLPDFSIEYVSESATAVLGFPIEAFKRPGFWESAVHPEDLSRVQSGLSGLFASGRHIHEYRHRHADGSYRWLRDEVRLVPGEDGRPARAVGASFDITERKVSETRLVALLTMQQIVSRAAAGFLGSRAEEGDVFIQDALAAVGQHTNADRAYLFQAAGGLISNTHEWCADGVTAQRDLLQGMPETDFSFFMAPIRQGSPLFIESVAALPPEARAEQELLASQGIETLLAVPLLIDGNLHGFVGLDNLRVEPLHPTEFASLLQLLADTLAAGLQRASDKQALDQLNERLTRKTEQQQGLLELSTEMLGSGSQAELFEMMQGRLGPVLGVDRVSLFERIPGTDRFHIRLLDLDPDLLAGMSDFVNPRRPETDLLAAELEGSAPMEAMRRGAPVTTREHRVADFPDWRHLHERQGHDQFVVVPLVSRQGVFGTLNVGFTRPEPPTLEEVDWVSQFRSMLSAHLSMHEAREALRALNLELESRVEARTRELRASEARFERLFQHAPQAMLIIDGSRRVVQSNRSAQHLFGRGEDEFVGTPVNELVPEPARDHHSHLMEGFIRESAARAMAVGRLVQALRQDGTVFAAEIGLVPIDLNGETHILAGVSDINARHEAQKALTESLREKETLLKETHHRVKNNLQIISSLLMLQSEQMPSDQARQLLQESVLRVRSMALIHQQLYGMGSFERIDLGDYTRQLAESLRSALAPLARLRVDAAVVEVTVETAVPLGLILNELLTNAFKYGLRPRGAVPGASPGRTGEHDVLVEIGLEGEQLRVAVLDSGDGIPEDVVSNTTSLGLHLVRALNRQLRGKLAIDVDRGSRVVLTCPRPTERQYLGNSNRDP